MTPARSLALTGALTFVASLAFCRAVEAAHSLEWSVGWAAVLVLVHRVAAFEAKAGKP